MNLYEKERNGSQKRTATTKFVVSRWYIPGGYMYDSARNIDIFFDNEEDANAYAKEYEMPPEMASILPIASYDNIIARVCKNYRDYKKRFYLDFAEEDRPSYLRRI